MDESVPSAHTLASRLVLRGVSARIVAVAGSQAHPDDDALSALGAGRNRVGVEQRDAYNEGSESAIVDKWPREATESKTETGQVAGVSGRFPQIETSPLESSV